MPRISFSRQDISVSSPHLCRALEKTTARDRNCVLGRERKRVDAEMSLGAAGKSACATKPRGPHSVFWKMYKLEGAHCALRFQFPASQSVDEARVQPSVTKWAVHPVSRAIAGLPRSTCSGCL